jgi:hypothetical protein
MNCDPRHASSLSCRAPPRRSLQRAFQATHRTTAALSAAPSRAVCRNTHVAHCRTPLDPAESGRASLALLHEPTRSGRA